MDRIDADTPGVAHSHGARTTTGAPLDATAGRIPLYTPAPESIAQSQLTAFTAVLQAVTGRTFPDYAALHRFSVLEFRTFWRCFLQWSENLQWTGDIEPICDGNACETAVFFPNLQLNYADNVLGLGMADAEQPAIIACHGDGRRLSLTRGQLRDKVMRLAQALAELGLREGDRVAAIMRNDGEAIIATLAVTALGATLSSAAPEMGQETIVDRFEPLSPRLLLAHTVSQSFDTGASIASNVAAVAAKLPSLQGIVCLDDGALPSTVAIPIHSLAKLIGQGDPERFVWRRFPFNHPLFILFSSGTTGRPKCIVHGAGGTLLEHVKEHRLHGDLRPGDTLFFHTSCSWMMWNWQLSALACGATIVLYDGPIATVDILWRIVANEQVTVFGTSPAYLKMCESAALAPGRQFDLSALRAVLSTGSVLYDAQFTWVLDQVKDVPLQSISGGTDILGCFVLGNPNLPVFAGECQCRSLALDVQAWSDNDNGPTPSIGQLVCTNPFPSRPLGFFEDPDGARFHRAYFAANPGVWTHGDLIEFSAQGTARLHGRCDGVLNVRGINIGPGEIYRALQGLPMIREAMVVEQRPSHPSATLATNRIVLLLVMSDGVSLTGALAGKVRRELARRASPAHVPDVIIRVDALPVTHSGKFSESAARDAVNGLDVANAGALRNAACLDAIRHHPALHMSLDDVPPAGSSVNDLERHLQALWEALFGFAPIARDDNFFELGGHSLLAARLLAEVQRSTGRAIPLATMLIAPTIERLAAVIQQACPPPSSTLVPMRAGVGAPLFIAHSLTGTVMESWALAGALRSPRPVFGLQARGLDGEEAAQHRIAEMAITCIGQMRTVQPDGPYAVAGYSLGGLVAFEIARQLTAMGEKVSLVALLDTYVHERCLSWGAWLRFQQAHVAREIAALRRFSTRQRLAYVPNKLAGAVDRVRMRIGLLPARPAADAANLPPHLKEVREAMRAAMAGYRPQPYTGGPVIYLRAAVPQSDCGDPVPVWQSVARRGLTIIDVPGNHIDVIVEPNVQRVAEVLDRYL